MGRLGNSRGEMAEGTTEKEEAREQGKDKESSSEPSQVRSRAERSGREGSA